MTKERALIYKKNVIVGILKGIIVKNHTPCLFHISEDKDQVFSGRPVILIHVLRNLSHISC